MLNNKRQFHAPITTYINERSLYNHYRSLLEYQVYLIIITEALKSETFHIGKSDKCSRSVDKVRRTPAFSSCRELDNKMVVMKQQILAVNPKTVGKSIYNHETIICALARITSKLSK